MGLKKRGVRTGDGPHRDSYQRKKFGVGRRQKAGEPCPKKKK